MPVIINKSAALQSLLIKNKDTRSESIDSFSSTVDVHAPFHAHGQSKLPHYYPDKANEELIVDDDLSFSSTSTLSTYANPSSSSIRDASSPHFDFKLPHKHNHNHNHNQTLAPQEQQRQQSALNSILTLSSPDCCPRVSNLLSKYNSHLVNVGSHLLEGLRASAPNQLAARVGDYNENLFYEMRDIDCIGSYICNTSASSSSNHHDNESPSSSSTTTSSSSSIEQDVTAFEHSIRTSLTSKKHSSSQNNNNIKYRGSFMSTQTTMYQPAHYDYDYSILQKYGQSLFLAFFPLTEEGSYLQLWQEPEENEGNDNGKTNNVEGTVVYIPYGKMLIAPSDTLHGGGFKRGSSGNLRFHLYIELICDEEEVPATTREVVVAAKEEEVEKQEVGDEEIKQLLDHPMNKYTERHDRRRELCERFVDARGLDSLLGVFFDT